MSCCCEQSHDKLQNWHADSSRQSIVHLSRERTAPRDLKPNLSQILNSFWLHSKACYFHSQTTQKACGFQRSASAPENNICDKNMLKQGELKAKTFCQTQKLFIKGIIMKTMSSTTPLLHFLCSTFCGLHAGFAKHIPPSNSLHLSGVL